MRNSLRNSQSIRRSRSSLNESKQSSTSKRSSSGKGVVIKQSTSISSLEEAYKKQRTKKRVKLSNNGLDFIEEKVVTHKIDKTPTSK